MDNKLKSSKLRLVRRRVLTAEGYTAIFGRLLLKYRLHFLHCSLSSEIGLRGVAQKGHMSSLAKLLGSSTSSSLDFEPSRAGKDSECLLPYKANATTATIATDTPIVISGQMLAQTFDTYVCMKGL
jgi:hypothetical protein